MMLSIFTREQSRPTIAGRFAALPANLQQHANERRFVCWRFGSTPNGRGKYPKLPFNPIKTVKIVDDEPKETYLAARMDDPTTWGTFAEVCAALRDWPKWFGGWGIVLMPGEVGIDLDDVVANGELHPYYAAIVATFHGRAYIEASVSKSGVHIIALGRCDEARKTDAIEVYPGGTGRFFTVSGLELEDSARPGPAQEAIDQVMHRVARSGKRAPAGGNTGCGTAPPDAAIVEAQQRLAELWKSLHNNATPQLIDLVKYNRYPAGMGTTASDARAVVVAQLQRAPKRSYTDAEIVVLALELWRKKGYEGQMAGNTARLQRDAIRLIEKYRPRGRTIKPKPPADKRRTQAGDIDRFFAFLQERISGPTSVKTADLAAEHGISRRSAITYLDRLAAGGRIHIERKRGRNGGMVIGFGPADNVQAFSTDEAPVCAAPTPETAPSGAAPHNTDQDLTTRVPTREGHDHILPQSLSLADLVAAAREALPKKRLDERTGEIKPWPRTAKRIIAELAGGTYDQATLQRAVPVILARIRKAERNAEFQRVHSKQSDALDKKIATLGSAIARYERLAGIDDPYSPEIARKFGTWDAKEKRATRPAWSSNAERDALRTGWLKEASSKRGILAMHTRERAERDAREERREGHTQHEQQYLLDLVDNLRLGRGYKPPTRTGYTPDQCNAWLGQRPAEHEEPPKSAGVNWALVDQLHSAPDAEFRAWLQQRTAVCGAD